MTAINKLKCGALAMAIVGIAAFILRQHQQIERLMSEKAVLYDEAREAAVQRNETERLTALVKSTTEGSKADREELMRLRAQSSKLGQLNQENAQLKAERQRLVSQVNQSRQQQLPQSELNASSTPVGVNDLGTVELLDQTPMRLDLGQGHACVVTATMLADGQLQMNFTSDSKVDGIPVQLKQTATVFPGTAMAMKINGVEITLSPKLKSK